jgi:hypothetical protein
MWRVKPLTPDTVSLTYVEQVVDESDYAGAGGSHTVRIEHFLAQVARKELK